MPDPTSQPPPRRRPTERTFVGFEKAIDTMQLGVTITDTQGRILYTNRADAAMHGFTPEELIGQEVRVFAPQGTGKPLSKPDLDAMRSWRRETINVRKNGTTFPVHLMSDVVKDRDGNTIGVVTTCEDITERKQVEEQLVHGALHDALTGFPNRTLFLTLLERAIGRAKRRHDTVFAVLFVDLDRFKLVNESLGHSFGDELLVAISKRLDACLRPGDVAARLGGDEFAILLDDLRDPRDATRVAERVLEELHAPVELAGHEHFATASIGIALSTTEHDRPENHLRDADTAMYRAKALGGNRYELFDKQMHQRAVTRLRLESELRRALEREEFHVQYQPIVRIASRRIHGFEALVRWRKEGGDTLVPPGEFIPIAEDTGLIVPIGWWVMKTACRQTATWIEQFPEETDLSMSVNISARHFQEDGLSDHVMEILREANLPPHRLKLELTESSLMDDPDAHIAVIRQLRAQGVHVHIDDFGTGYSSLSYLNRFSVDSLKIDQSFIREAESGESWEIVQMIIDLARDMGVGVIAEGVESESQTERLRDLACDHAQGYLFDRPLDAEAATALLVAQRQAYLRAKNVER